MEKFKIPVDADTEIDYDEGAYAIPEAFGLSSFAAREKLLDITETIKRSTEPTNVPKVLVENVKIGAISPAELMILATIGLRVCLDGIPDISVSIPDGLIENEPKEQEEPRPEDGAEADNGDE